MGSNGLIYVLGGVTASGSTGNVESTNTWTTETALPAPVSQEAAVVDSLLHSLFDVILNSECIRDAMRIPPEGKCHDSPSMHVETLRRSLR